METEYKDDHRESGFYCKVCDCVVKDSLNFDDHNNGKKHLRNLGIHVKKFTDCTLEEVKEMLEFKKREREEKALGLTFEEREKEDEERWRRLKREKKKRQKARRSDRDIYEEGDEDEDKDDEESDDEQKDQDDDDNTMEKLMGFSSFSGSKK